MVKLLDFVWADAYRARSLKKAFGYPPDGQDADDTPDLTLEFSPTALIHGLFLGDDTSPVITGITGPSVCAPGGI